MNWEGMELEKDGFKNITVLKKRVTANYGAGVACGPFGFDTVDVEIVVQDNGKKVYLHGCWCSEAPDIEFNVTAESVYDLYVRLFDCNDDKANDLLEIRKRILENAETDAFLKNAVETERYKDQYEEIKKTIAYEIGWEE